MRKLIVAEHLSMDGVIQAPGGPEEDLDGDFRLGGWMWPYMDEGTGEAVEALHSRPFELLLGRNTYDLWAAYWPHVPPDSPGRALADVFDSVPKHVVTHRPEGLDWAKSRALEGDVAYAVGTLKEEEGDDLLAWGSGSVVRQLLAFGLVDELRLLIYPVVLGRGKRLFDGTARASAFELAHSTTTPGGVLVTHYVHSGDVRTGSGG